MHVAPLSRDLLCVFLQTEIVLQFVHVLVYAVPFAHYQGILPFEHGTFLTHSGQVPLENRTVCEVQTGPGSLTTKWRSLKLGLL